MRNETRGEGDGEEEDEDYQGLSHVDGCDVTGSAVILTCVFVFLKVMRIEHYCPGFSSENH